MLFKIDDITEDGLHFKTIRRSDWVTNIPELVDKGSDLSLVKDIEFDITLTKLLNEIIVNGFLSFGIRGRCSRCLEDVDINIKSDVNLVLTPKENDSSDIGDLDHEFYEGDSIDLSNFLREIVAINIPFNFICSENCNGLCSSCGTNLNKERCKCEKDKNKSAFAVLKDIKL